MNRPQHNDRIADIEVLRLENGAIDYAAYGVRARKERSMAILAAAGSLVEFTRSTLIGMRGSVVGLTKAVLQRARNCDPAGPRIGQSCPKPLGS